ncbi:MAG TPA: isoleucine--tRNA ligase, partial [Clostridiales bacterium]|nr:isoleucine--tRNA ligase [Clostridiales bacterium]
VVEGFKDEAVNAIHHVRWIPAWGESRIESMVKDRADWCISRQRTWGVPIPIFYCADCKKTIISKKAIDRIAVLFEKEGSNAWYKYSPREMIGDLAVCDACGSTDLEKETDIMDVWFD